MRNIILIIIILLFANNSFGQKSEKELGHFGGPFATISYNQHGSAVTFGGGGTFLVKRGAFIGIFGQGITGLIPRTANVKGFETWVMKARYTGFWVGYFDSLERYSHLHISYFTKVGFGSVYLDNPSSTIHHYDSSILIAPHIEPILNITSFFEIGIGMFYEFHIGVDLKSLRSKDFNSMGMNITFRFNSKD